MQRIGAPDSVTLTMPEPAPVGVNDFGVDGAGRIVVSAEFRRRGSDFGTYVARFLPTGALDTTFGAGGKVELHRRAGAGNLIVKRDGRVFAIDFRRWVRGSAPTAGRCRGSSRAACRARARATSTPDR